VVDLGQPVLPSGPVAGPRPEAVPSRTDLEALGLPRSSRGVPHAGRRTAGLQPPDRTRPRLPPARGALDVPRRSSTTQMTVFSTSAIELQNTPHQTMAAQNAVLSSRVMATVNSSRRTKRSLSLTNRRAGCHPNREQRAGARPVFRNRRGDPRDFQLREAETPSRHSRSVSSALSPIGPPSSDSARVAGTGSPSDGANSTAWPADHVRAFEQTPLSTRGACARRIATVRG